MKCPQCRNGSVAEVAAGRNAKEFLLACMNCAWQVTRDALQAWRARWK